MAGSLKQMVYKSDNTKLGLDGLDGDAAANRRYVVTIDESNGEACGFADYNGQDDNDVEAFPKGVEMRYILCEYKEGSQNVRRKLWVGDPKHPLFTDGGSINLLVVKGPASAESEAFSITSAHGEKRSFKYAPQNGGSGGSQGGEDTGLTDGDDD